MHARDKVLLEEIQNYYQVGNISLNSKGGISFRIKSTKDLPKIVAHLDLYPLKLKKKIRLLTFFCSMKLEILNLILNKEHLTKSGLHKIVAIKATMNLGLSNSLSLQEAFHDVIPTLLQSKRPRPRHVFNNMTL